MTSWIVYLGEGTQQFLVGSLQILLVALETSGGSNPHPRGLAPLSRQVK